MSAVVSESGVPDLQHEVNRKAFNALDSLVVRLEAGKITDQQYAIGIETLFDALSGLVSDPDFFYIIGELRSKVPAKMKSVMAFMNKEEVFIAQHVLGSADMVVVKGEIKQVKRYDLSEEAKPDFAALQKMNAAAEAFTARGYRRLV